LPRTSYLAGCHHSSHLLAVGARIEIEANPSVTVLPGEATREPLRRFSEALRAIPGEERGMPWVGCG
jgi:hypothetical protein